jgi:hypothetical protein
VTLYDIEVTHQDTEDRDGLRYPGCQMNKRITVTVTPYLPLIVPPGSTLIINRDRGPEAHMTGADTTLVTRGDHHYTNSRIMDGYVLTQLGALEAPEYLANASEDLIVESLRNMAEIEVKKLK